MSDNAITNTAVRILESEIKSRLNGNLDIVVSGSKKWVYLETDIATGTTATQLIPNGTSFLNSTTTVANADEILWIAIKHLGVDSSGNKTDDGVMVGYDSTDPAYNGSDSAHTNGMLISANELFVFKPLRSDTSDIEAITVGGTATGAPSDITQGATSVKVRIAAVIYDGV